MFAPIAVAWLAVVAVRPADGSDRAPTARPAAVTVAAAANPAAAVRDDADARRRPLERVRPKWVTPAMVAAAQRFINLPMGSERYVVVDGKTYVCVLERHYHPPGFVGAPTGYHKGVTLYELRSP